MHIQLLNRKPVAKYATGFFLPARFSFTRAHYRFSLVLRKGDTGKSQKSTAQSRSVSGQPLKLVNMKKTIILLAAVFAAHFVSIAQNTRVGFTAGVSMSNYKITADNLSIKGDTKAGITFGVLVDAPLSDHLSLQPALNFIQKGLNNTNDLGGGVTEKSKSTINLIEVPVNFLYNSNGKGGNFFVGAGPSLGFGISGNSRTTYSDGTPEESSKIKFGNTIDDDLKGLDLGANLLAGYCLKGGFMFSVNYNLGLSNLVPKPEGNEKMKSHYIGIKLGWMLAGDQKKKKD